MLSPKNQPNKKPWTEVTEVITKKFLSERILGQTLLPLPIKQYLKAEVVSSKLSVCYSKLCHFTMQMEIISNFISSGCSCCMLWSHTWLPSKICFKKNQTWEVFVFTTIHTVLFQKIDHLLIIQTFFIVSLLEFILFYFISKLTNAYALLQEQDGCSFSSLVE